jgi:hypothetical protein
MLVEKVEINKETPKRRRYFLTQKIVRCFLQKRPSYIVSTKVRRSKEKMSQPLRNRQQRKKCCFLLFCSCCCVMCDGIRKHIKPQYLLERIGTTPQTYIMSGEANNVSPLAKYKLVFLGDQGVGEY